MTDSSGCREPLKPYRQLPGKTPGEKCEAIGIVPGKLMPLSELREIQEKCRITVFLFFDERIARHSTMQNDIENYSLLPPKARPYLELLQFYRVIEEDGLEFPDDGSVSAEILTVGELECPSCGGIHYDPYIRALLLSDE